MTTTPLCPGCGHAVESHLDGCHAEVGDYTCTCNSTRDQLTNNPGKQETCNHCNHQVHTGTCTVFPHAGLAGLMCGCAGIIRGTPLRSN